MHFAHTRLHHRKHRLIDAQIGGRVTSNTRVLLISNPSEVCPTAHLLHELAHRLVFLFPNYYCVFLFSYSSLILHPYNTFTFLPLQNLVNKFFATVNNQKPRIDQLDKDTDNLSDDINTLKEKVSNVPKKSI